MNTPTPTPITEGHKKLWTKLYNLAHDQIFDDFEQSDDPAHQLIADSEARATAELRDSLALEQDIGNAACDELRGDADDLRADVVRLSACAEKAERAETVALANWNGALERALKAEAERDQLHGAAAHRDLRAGEVRLRGSKIVENKSLQTKRARFW